ncbi:DUF4388 domain-containing protein [Deinococcus wulumuqiensis]|uniref:DUF4388 domain-containing protein n=1 Tax=Deinococcus wulumuqiensis TaxID=980427 RepID=A0A345IEM3_9DEIO|nr:DUF4388 domain-containing protein [Deinococcus wulumuqiensis]AXG98145.1 DUF4388 domain-containing protein [Deinococcus wulumuqiensis]
MTLGNLADFDVLQLLLLLAQGKRTGVLRVQRPGALFQCWLEGGQVRRVSLRRLRGAPGESDLEGAEALVGLLREPSGHFQFDEGVRSAHRPLDVPLDVVAYAALRELPAPELPFTGPARVTDPARLAAFPWSLSEWEVLDRIRAQVPLGDLAADPGAAALAARLARLGLLRERRLRTARLLVAVTHEVAGAVLVDAMIVERWKGDLGRLPEHVGVRDEGGKSYRFPVRGHPEVGALILIPPDVLTKTRLQAGESVLVKPA